MYRVHALVFNLVGCLMVKQDTIADYNMYWLDDVSHTKQSTA